ELLLDTGLGESTYSIITQGQVDAILSNKGDERRAVFEEAAGINKYKTRKVSAEKKLISAEQNMLRINDLKIEVSEHIITLEEQAKKAKHYLEVQTEVQAIDLGLSKKLITNIIDKRNTLLSELEVVRQAAHTKKEAEEKEINRLSLLKEKHRLLEHEIDELATKAEGEKDLLREIELDRRFLDSELARAKKTAAETNNQIQQTNEKIALLSTLLCEEQKGIDLSDTPAPELFEEII
ncbi:MAG: hypothetical protein KJ811_02105, partial [Candidatus Margulisbacteria bacterium]|nr:hypothetical protein [Candidatus Margulisiibacteriota bacterium]